MPGPDEPGINSLIKLLLNVLLDRIGAGIDVAAEEKHSRDGLVSEESVELAQEFAEIVEIVIISYFADSVDVDMCKVVIFGADAADEC